MERGWASCWAESKVSTSLARFLRYEGILVDTFYSLYHIELVDSTSGHGPDVTYTKYITKTSWKWYTFKTSNLHYRVLRVILDLVHLPLYQQTVVYIQNRQVPKIAFCPSSSFAFRCANSRTYCSISICFVYYKAVLWTLTFSQISRTFE